MTTLKPLQGDKKAKAVNEEGLAMKAQGDSEKAIRVFQEALDVYKESFRAHPDIAAVYEIFRLVSGS